MSRNGLVDRVISALLWLAAFCFAVGIFLAATQLLRWLPPTPPIAVGRVTVERASKLRDYVTAILFFLIVPAATILVHRLGTDENARLRRAFAWRRRDVTGLQNLASLLFVAPFFLAPFLYLTTFKVGWPLLIPLLLSELGARAVIALDRKRWLQQFLRRELLPLHALVLTEAFAWILFRYLAVGRRIAHIPTLFLEIVFVLLFLLIYWSALALIARLASFTTRLPMEVAFQRLAIAGLPLVILPGLAMAFVHADTAITIVMLMTLASIVVALRGREPVDGRQVRNAVAWVILPFLLFCISYASTASLTQWIDLFHRGEALGPASDYLRGKVPYRDVFVLHGLLDDGMLEAWLMELFGRHVELALYRPVILGSCQVAALWCLGMVVFDSIPLSLIVILLGAATTTDNERALFEIAVVALLLGGIRRRSPWLVAGAGIAAAVALFFSFDIGLYCIGGAIISLAILHRRGLLSFAAGFAAGATPFLLFLGLGGALGPFFEISFVTLPRIIDAIWSLPYPDLTTTFRKDLNLHTISDFFLFERFRYVLNPLVIVIALTVLAWRAVRREREPVDAALLVLTVFAVLTQRSALGRADFPHQYFSAFLIGPMLIVLGVLAARSASRIWRQNDHAAQAFLLLAAVAFAPVLIVALWVPDIINGRLDDTLRYQARVSGAIVDPEATEIRHRIEQVGYFVATLSKKGAPIFDFSNQPAFYFFCDRPNPTRFYQVPILSPREFQRETILALERAKPPIVIRRSAQGFDLFDDIDNSIRAQAVAAYIDEHYQYAHSARGVEVWTRKPAPNGPLNLAAYMARIRVPTLAQLNAIGARSRLVFPTVGSVAGANDTYWQSDLTLFNPFHEPMTLALRYVSGETVRADRSVTIGAGKSIRWEDVVRTFFGAPQGKGVLWVEYRGAHAPVARLKTYDAAHNAKASIDLPLSMRDAATSVVDTSDLTVAGIPGGQNRRINLGVVNVGEIPATVRVTVRTRDGRLVGKPIETGFAEDETWNLVDAESSLGVRIDDTMIVHMTVVAGTCVGYATVVEFTGDTQFLPAVPAQQP